jgi:hypothetical protein
MPAAIAGLIWRFNAQRQRVSEIGERRADSQRIQDLGRCSAARLRGRSRRARSSRREVAVSATALCALTSFEGHLSASFGLFGTKSAMCH